MTLNWGFYYFEIVSESSKEDRLLGDLFNRLAGGGYKEVTLDIENGRSTLLFEM